MSKLYETILNFHNDFRVMPKIIAIYLGYMFYLFHMWFVTLPTHGEWSIVGYATVLGAIVGFAKFYMETTATKRDE